MEIENRQLVSKCCFCFDLKLGATLAVFWHAVPYSVHLFVLQEPHSMRFYFSICGLCMYAVFLVPYMAGVWCCKKTILQTPLLVFYVFSMVVINVMIALPGKRDKFGLEVGVRVALEVTVALILFLIDVYFFTVLYSLYIRMRRAELDARRAPQ